MQTPLSSMRSRYFSPFFLSQNDRVTFHNVFNLRYQSTCDNERIFKKYLSIQAAYDNTQGSAHYVHC